MKRLLGAMVGFTVCLVPWWLPSRAIAGDAEPGLVARYALDEGEGTVARDSGPAAAHGRIVGGTWLRQGAGWALRFDGSRDHVTCGAPAALDLTGTAITLSAWVMPEETPAGEVGICGKHFSSYLLTYYQDVHAYWYIASGGNNTKAVLPGGMWTHVAGTFDGTTLRFYINGDLAMERLSQAATIPAGRTFTIGCVVGDPTAADPNYTQSGFFRGCIADVRVYDQALPAERLRRQYGEGAAGRFGLTMADVERLPCATAVEAEGIRVGLTPGGALQIETHGTFLLADSRFSYPGDSIGWNALAGASASAAAWEPVGVAVDARSLRLTAQCPFYRLERSVAVDAGRVRVRDRVTNPGTAPVGILVRQRVTTAQPIAAARLGVRACDALAFGATAGLDVGLLPEDDVSRAMFGGFRSGNSLGYQLSHFSLAGGQSHCFEWSLYLLPPTADPLAFINRVRQDFGLNHRIPGPCSFFDATSPLLDRPAALQAHLTRRRLGVAMLSPWLDYDPGILPATPTRAEYKAMMQRACRALKAACPGIRVIGCIETDWVGIFPDRIPGGEKLPRPRSNLTGSVWLEPEAAAVIRDSKLPWLDSLKIDRQGRPVLELYVRGGQPQWALGVYPAPGNYQARFLLEQARFLCEEVGLDGWYIDEFCPFWVRSYDRPDGTTVGIDPATGRITGNYTDAGFAGIQPRLDLCHYAVRNGYTMICNTYASTVAEARLPVLRFAETWSAFDPRSLPASGRPPWIPELGTSQLGTMIGLGADGRHLKTPSAELLMRAIVTYLRHGMVYYHYFYGDLPETGDGSGGYGPINHMFPITPVRLFEGGIEGRERTVTAVSGVYDWLQPAKPVVRVFGPDGREVTVAVPIQPLGTGWRIRLGLDDWRQIAVIAGD